MQCQIGAFLENLHFLEKNSRYRHAMPFLRGLKVAIFNVQGTSKSKKIIRTNQYVTKMKKYVCFGIISSKAFGSPPYAIRISDESSNEVRTNSTLPTSVPKLFSPYLLKYHRLLHAICYDWLSYDRWHRWYQTRGRRDTFSNVINIIRHGMSHRQNDAPFTEL